MDKINFVNGTSPYLNAQNLNQMQDNVEQSINNTDEKAEQYSAYSTTEQVVGTWIDGKPLYRKVYDVGSFPNAREKTISLGFNCNSVKIIKMYGNAYSTSNNQHISIPYNYVGEQVSISCYNNVISINSQIDKSMFSGYVVLEYTKTTD